MAKLRIASRLNLDVLSADEKKHVKAIGYSSGSLTRMFCTCGYVSDCIQDECPQCNAPVSRYKGRFKQEVLSLQKNKVCIAPHQELLQTERTYFVADHAAGDSEVVMRSRIEVSNTLINHLDSILVEKYVIPADQTGFSPFLKMAIEVYQNTRDESWSATASYTASSCWNRLYEFVRRCMNEQPNVTAQQIITMFEALGGNSYKVPNLALCTQPIQYYNQLMSLTPEIQTLISFLNDRLTVCVTTEDIAVIEKGLPTGIAMWISANIEHLGAPLKIALEIASRGPDLSNSECEKIIRFLKAHKFRLVPIGDFIDHMKREAVFSVKDYYLFKNMNSLSKVYPMQSVAEALKNVYEDPTGAIIALAALTKT